MLLVTKILIIRSDLTVQTRIHAEKNTHSCRLGRMNERDHTIQKALLRKQKHKHLFDGKAI